MTYGSYMRPSEKNTLYHAGYLAKPQQKKRAGDHRDPQQEGGGHKHEHKHEHEHKHSTREVVTLITSTPVTEWALLF